MKSGRKLRVSFLVLTVIVALGFGLMEALAALSEKKIIPDDIPAGAQFGSASAISENYALVGAKYADGAGAAYIFKRSGNNWNQVVIDDDNNAATPDIPLTLTASDGSSDDEFGCAVALDGETALIGAQFSNDTGAAYILKKNDADDNWVEQQKLVPSDSVAADYFGHSLDISGNVAVVGAYGKNSRTGAAYIFVKTDTGWTQQQKLTVSSGQPNDLFGRAVAMEGNTVFVGSPGNGTGKVFVFSWNETRSLWEQSAILTGINGIAGDQFGADIDISGNHAVIGAYGKSSSTGAAYVFSLTNGIWAQMDMFAPSDLQAGDLFGASVSIADNLVAVGAYKNRNSAIQTGSVYTYQLKEGAWEFQEKTTAKDGLSNDWFGISVSTSAEYTLVGAAGSDEIAVDAGMAYIYENAVITGDSNAGDINGDGIVDFSDLILALKIMAGIDLAPDVTIQLQADVNNDGKIGMAEAIFIIQDIAGIRGDITFTVSPSALFADGVSKSRISVLVVDEKGNPIIDGSTVSFVIDSGPGALSAETAATVNGVAEIDYLVSTLPGETKIAATSGDLTRTTTITALPVEGTITVTASPEVLPADNVSHESTVTAKVNPALEGVEIRFSKKSGPGNITEYTVVTGPDGTASTDFFVQTSAESETIILAESDGYISGSKKLIIYKPVPVGVFELTTDKNSIPADNGASYMTVTARLEDQDGNDIDGQPVVFTTDQGYFNISGNRMAQVLTDNTGRAEVRLISGSEPSLVTLTAEYNSFGVQKQVVFSGTASGTDTRWIVLEADSSDVPADGVSSVEITARAYTSAGQPVAFGKELIFSTSLGTFPSDGDADPMTYTTMTDNDNGTASVRLWAGDAAGLATVTCTSDGATQTAYVVLTDNSAINVPAVMLLNANPNTLPADGKSSATITANLRDSKNEPVPSGTVVVFTTDLGAFPNDGDNDPQTYTTFTPNEAGTITLSLMAGNVAGTATITAATNPDDPADGVTQKTEVVFEPAGLTRLSVSADPAAITANGEDTSVVTATLTTKAGDPIEGETITFSRVFEEEDDNAASIANTFSDTGNKVTDTFEISATGITQFTFTHTGEGLFDVDLFNTAGGGEVYLFTEVGLVLDNQILETVDPGTYRMSVTADGPWTITLQGDNVVPFESNTGNTNEPANPELAEIITDADGHAVYEFTAGTVAEVVTIQASTEDVSAQTSILQNPGPLTLISVRAADNEIYANGEISTLVTVQAVDENGNLVNDDVDVLLTATSGTFENGSDEITLTTANGEAKTTLTSIASEVSITSVITAESSSLTDTTEVVFTGVRLTDLSSNKQSLFTNGADNAAISVKLKDSDGVIINGESIQFTTTAGSLNSSTDDTENNGVAEVTLISSLNEETAIVTASYGQLSQNMEIEMIDPPVGGYVTLNIAAAELLADGVSSTSLTTTLFDADGEPVPAGTSVVFETTLGAFPDDGDGDPKTYTTVTNDSGTVSVSLMAGTVSGQAKITVKANDITQQVSLNLTNVDEIEGDVELVFDAEPRAISANGQSSSELTVLARDGNHNPVKNALIHFSTNLGTVTSSAVTDSEGYALATLISEKVNGVATVTAQYSENVTQSRIVAFTGIEIEVTANASAEVGVSESSVTAKLTGPSNQPIADQKIKLTMNNVDGSVPNATFSNGLQEIILTTDFVGEVTTSVTSAVGEIVEIAAAHYHPDIDASILTETVATTQVQFSGYNIEIDPVKDFLVANPDDEEQKTEINIRLTYEGAAVDGAKLLLSTTQGKLNGLEGVELITDSNGEVSVMLTPGSVVGMALITAVYETNETNVAFEYEFPMTSGDVASVEMIINPSMVSVNGGEAEIIVNVKDEKGNPVGSTQVVFSIIDGPGGGERIYPGRLVTPNFSASQEYPGQVKAKFIAGALGSESMDDVKILAVAGYGSNLKTDEKNLTIVGEPANITLGVCTACFEKADDGSFSQPAIAIVTDVNGIVMPAGYPVHFSVSEPSKAGILSPVLTDDNGVATTKIIYVEDYAGAEYLLTATCQGVAETKEVHNARAGETVDFVDLVPDKTDVVGTGIVTRSYNVETTINAMEFTTRALNSQGERVSIPVQFESCTDEFGLCTDPCTGDGAGNFAGRYRWYYTNYNVRFTPTASEEDYTAYVRAYTGVDELKVCSEVIGINVRGVKIELESEDDALVANGLSQTKITARITERESGSPLVDTEVNFASLYGNIEIDGRTNRTDDAGVITATYTSPKNKNADLVEKVTLYLGPDLKKEHEISVLKMPDVQDIIPYASREYVYAVPTETSEITVQLETLDGTVFPNGQEVKLKIENGGPGQVPERAFTKDGKVVFTFTATAEPGTAKIIMESGGMTKTLSINVLPLPAGGYITLEATDEELPANGNSSTAIKATVYDTSGDPVPLGTPLTFKTTLGSFPDDGDETTDSQTYKAFTTNDDGTVTISLIAGNITGQAEISVEYEGGVQQVAVMLTPVDVIEGDVELLFEAADWDIPADGEAQTDLRLLVRDSNNNPVKNTLIRLKTDLGTVPATALTDADGYAKIDGQWPTLTSERINGVATVTATYGEDDAATTRVAFSDIRISIQANSTELTSGESTGITATLNLPGAEGPDGPPGAPIANQQIELTIAEPASAVFSDGSKTLIKTTDTDGRVTETITSQVGETVTVWARHYIPDAVADLKDTAASTSVKFSGYSLDIIPAKDFMIADGADPDGPSQTDVVIVLKYEGVPVSSKETVVLGTTQGNINSEVTTDENGEAVAVLTAGSVVGDAVITAVYRNDDGEEVVSKQYPYPLQSSLVETVELIVDPPVIKVGSGQAAITAIVRDEYGNPVQNTQVLFGLISGPGGGEKISSDKARRRTGEDGTPGQAQTTFEAGALGSSTPGDVIIRAIAGYGTNQVVATVNLTIVNVPYNIALGVCSDVEDCVVNNGDGTFSMPVTAVITDVNGIVMPAGIPVYFSNDDPTVAGIVSPAATDDQGVASTIILYPGSQEGEEYNITATCRGVSVTQKVRNPLPEDKIANVNIIEFPSSLRATGITDEDDSFGLIMAQTINVNGEVFSLASTFSVNMKSDFTGADAGTIWNVSPPGAVFSGETAYETNATRAYFTPKASKEDFTAYLKACTGESTAVVCSDSEEDPIEILCKGITLELEPADNTLTANGLSSTEILARVYETTTGLPVSNVELNFGAINGLIERNANVTDASGTMTATYTSVEYNSIKYQDDAPDDPKAIVTVFLGPDLSEDITIDLTEMPAVGALTAYASKNTVYAVPSDESTITVQLTTEDGEIFPDGQLVKFSIQDGGPGQIPAIAYTQNGRVTVDFIATSTPGTANIEITSGLETITLPIEVLPVPAGGYITLTAADPSLVADGFSSTNLTATVYDAVGRPVPAGTEVTFASTLGWFTKDAVTQEPVKTIKVTTPDATGKVIVSLMAGVVDGTAEITCAANNMTQKTEVIFAPSGTTSLIINAEPDTLVADGESISTVWATLTAENGEPIVGEPVTFTRVFDNAGSTLTPSNTYTDTGNKVTDSFDITTNGLTTFTMSHSGTANFIVHLINVQTGDIRYLENEIGVVVTDETAEFLDAGTYRLEVTADGPWTVVVEGDNVQNAASGTVGDVELETVLTDDGGQASMGYRAGTRAEEITIKASTDTLEAQTTITQTPGDLALVSVSAEDAAIYANGANTTQVTVKLADANGNLLEETVDVELVATSGTFENDTLTVAGGEATTTLTAVSSETTVFSTLTATAQTQTGQPVSDTAAVEFTGVVLTDLAAVPELIVANGTDESTIRVKLKNADGIAISGEAITFTTDAGLFKTGAGADTNKITSDEGVATATLVASLTEGTAQVTANYGLLSEDLEVHFAPSPIGEVALTAGATELVADDGKSYVLLKAAITDPAGNPINKKVEFFTTGGALYLDSAKTTAYTAAIESVIGEVSIYLFSPSNLGNAKVTAKVGGVSDSVEIAFVSGSPAEGKIKVSAATGNLSVKGTTTLEISVMDQYDNPVADNEVVSVIAEYGGLSSYTALTLGGKTSVTYTAPSFVPEDGIDTITVETTDGYSATTDIRIIGPQIAGVEVSVSPESLPADGTSSATVNISLTMIGGGTVPDGVVVDLSITDFSDPLITDPEEWGSLPATATTAGGIATASLVSGNVPGTVTIRAEAGGKIAEAEVAYTPGLITVTAIPNTLLGTGSGTSKITVEVFDSGGNPVDDEMVQFVLNDLTLGTFTEEETIDNGKATTDFIASAKGGSVVISAIWSGAGTDVIGTATVDIQTPPDDIVVADLTPDPNPNPGNINIKGTGGISTSRIIFDVTDIFGEPVADGYRVDLSILDGPNGGEAIEPAIAYTKDGQVNAILRSGSKSGPVSIKATYYYNKVVSTVTSTITISSGPPVGEGFGIFAEYLNISGDWKSNLEDKISVNVGDVYGNAVPDGTAVSFFTYNTGGWFAPSEDTTVNGIATATLRTPGDNTSPLNGFVSVTAEVNNSGRTTRVNSIAVAPDEDNNIIYAGTNGGGVYKSTDSGSTWTNVSRSSENAKAGQNWIDPYIKGGSAICVDPDNSNVVYVGTGYLGRGSIYRSLDGGLNWNGKGDGNYSEEWNGLISTNGAILSVVCDGAGSDYVWAGGEGIGAVFAPDGETFQWGGLVVDGPTYIPDYSGAKGEMIDIGLSLTTRTETWTATYDVTGATVTEPLFNDLSGAGSDGTMTDVSATADAGADTWTATYLGGYNDDLSGSATDEGELLVEFTSATTRTEDWTVTCIDAEPDGEEVFRVRSQVSGSSLVTVHPEYNISEFPYVSKKGEIQFVIYENETGDFTKGDKFTFSTTRDQWRVEGDSAGLQANAYTDVPYTSDDGEVSFTINDGENRFYGKGDQWTFNTNETGEWLVYGSKSGVQQNTAYTDIPYVSDNEAVSFLITGAEDNLYADGDMVTFEVQESGLGYGRDVREIVKVPGTHGASAILYAATPNGLYRSNNGGLTWTKTRAFTGDHLTTIALHPLSNGTNDVIYVGTEDAGVHVLRTTNGDAATPAWSETAYNTGRGGGVRATPPSPGLNNQGNGVIDSVSVSTNTQSETWTVTFNGTDSEWTVRGTVSTGLPNAPTGTYSSPGEEVAFTIAEGSIPFADGDTFTFRTIRDPGNTIKDLLVDGLNDKLYAVTYFFGAEETHAIGNVYVIGLDETSHLPSGSWAEVNSGLPVFDPVDDPTLFAQHVLALDDPDSPSAVFIGGEGINFYKATGDLGAPATSMEWQESKYGLTNRIMARMPILFSGICSMNIASIQENNGVYTYTVYIQDRYGNPPVEGSTFTVTLTPEEGEASVLLRVAYPDAQIYDGTYRDPSDADTDNPYIIRVAPEPGDKVEFVFTPTCQDTAPGCSGSAQEWTARF